MSNIIMLSWNYYLMLNIAKHQNISCLLGDQIFFNFPLTASISGVDMMRRDYYELLCKLIDTFSRDPRWRGLVCSFLRKHVAGKKSIFSHTLGTLHSWIWNFIAPAHQLSILPYQFDIKIINFMVIWSTWYLWHP